MLWLETSRKVLMRFRVTLVAICLGLLLFLFGLESIEYRGMAPTIPDWFMATMFLPTLFAESVHGGFAMLLSLYLLQWALLGYVMDWLWGGR